MYAVDSGDKQDAVDLSITDVKPAGCTVPYAAPEVLKSLQLQVMGAPDGQNGVLVNGCAADMWSYGCIMYEMLTGCKPFLPAEEAFHLTVPSLVPSQAGDQWRVYDAFLHEQRQWVSACTRTVLAMLVAAFADKGLLTYVHKQRSHACRLS